MALPAIRRHGFDPVYDRMDRATLIALCHDRAMPGLGSRPEHMTRRELIDAILDSESSPAPGPSDDYPLRRPHQWVPTARLSALTGQRVLWRFAQATLGTLRALEHADTAALPDDRFPRRAGDLVLTAVNTSPALLLSIDQVVQAKAETTALEHLATFSNPLSLTQLEARTGNRLPRATQFLAVPDSERLLAAVTDALATPAPIFLTAGDCAAGASKGNYRTLLTLALLQSGAQEEPMCQVCERYNPSRLEAHLDRPGTEDLRLEIQDHIDDTVVLCSDCHAMAHNPTVQQLRGFARPACPDCGAPNPMQIIWGEPAIAFDEDVVLAGCVMSSGPTPRWQCRECEARYWVESARHAPEQMF
ncbi:hypothetical protein [Glutamicibacter sp. X7]